MIPIQSLNGTSLKIKLFALFCSLLASETQAAIYFCKAEKSSSLGYDTVINEVRSQTNFMVDTSRGYSTVGNQMVEQTISYVGSCRTTGSVIFCRDGTFERGDLNQSTLHLSTKDNRFLYVNHNTIVPLVTTVTGQCNPIAKS